MSNAHSTAAALLRRLHAKIADRELSDRDDAWFCQLSLLGEDVLNNVSLYQLQERVATLARLANPPRD